MKTIENNKLIAEFMGLNLHQGVWRKSTLATERKICKEDALKYYSDWNWLMKVVEKIESLNYIFEIKTTWCRIKEIGTGSVIVLRWEEDRTKIGAVYNACIDFINFYNEQNKVS